MCSCSSLLWKRTAEDKSIPKPKQNLNTVHNLTVILITSVFRKVILFGYIRVIHFANSSFWNLYQEVTLFNIRYFIRFYGSYLMTEENA